MGTMGMVIRRGLGELGPFLFVFRRRAPVFGIQVRGLGDIVFLRALLDGLPLVLRRRNLGPLDPPTEDEEPPTALPRASSCMCSATSTERLSFLLLKCFAQRSKYAATLDLC